MFTPEQLAPLLAAIPAAKTLWVAYSGGLDSHVLLHALANLSKSTLTAKVQAIHVNHQLHPQADSWANHCAQICQQLQIPLTIRIVNARPQAGEGPEAAARQARYAACAAILQPGDYLLTAHHQDDQAETLLLQLLRGAGPKGMAAMAVHKPFSQGFLLRPLLDFSQEQLTAYAQLQNLQWIDDDSNSNLQFDRNYLRHVILPRLKKRWPKAATAMSRAAKHCAQAETVISEIVQQDIAKCLGNQPNTLSIQRLISLPLARQHQVIRHWLQTLALPLPSAQHLKQLANDMLACAPDANPQLRWPGVVLRRYRDDLYAYPQEEPVVMPDSLAWTLESPLALPQQLGSLTCVSQIGLGIRQFTLEQPFQVRFRRGGESLQLRGHPISHSLKKLFQVWGVPPWLRDQTPLLFYQEQLVCVVGYGIAQSFAATAQEPAWQVSLQKAAT